jgi:ribosome-associated protein
MRHHSEPEDFSDEADDAYVSKTRRKKDMQALQELGEQLVALGNDRLAQLDLPESLLDAVKEAKRITKFGALSRQMQYIGKLMRDVDPTPIRAKLDEWAGHSKELNAKFHRLEKLRERLLEDDKALGEVAEQYPQADLQHLRALIRNARQEQLANKPPKSSRALFKALRALQEGDEAGTEPEDNEE